MSVFTITSIGEFVVVAVAVAVVVVVVLEKAGMYATRGQWSQCWICDYLRVRQAP